MPEQESAKPRPSTGLYMDMGFRVAVALLVFGGLGYWFDRAFGSLPLGTIVGVFVGAAAGMYSLYLTLFGPPRNST